MKQILASFLVLAFFSFNVFAHGHGAPPPPHGGHGGHVDVHVHHDDHHHHDGPSDGWWNGALICATALGVLDIASRNANPPVQTTTVVQAPPPPPANTVVVQQPVQPTVVVQQPTTTVVVEKPVVVQPVQPSTPTVIKTIDGQTIYTYPSMSGGAVIYR